MGKCCCSNQKDDHNYATCNNPPGSNPGYVTAEAVVVDSSAKPCYGAVPQSASSGTAQAIGAGVVGTAAGYILGSMFSGGGGHGDNGGYNVSGDSGGGGYNISGGGGYNISGDSGGGG